MLKRRKVSFTFLSFIHGEKQLFPPQRINSDSFFPPSFAITDAMKERKEQTKEQVPRPTKRKEEPLKANFLLLSPWKNEEGRGSLVLRPFPRGCLALPCFLCAVGVGRTPPSLVLKKAAEWACAAWDKISGWTGGVGLSSGKSVVLTGSEIITFFLVSSYYNSIVCTCTLYLWVVTCVPSVTSD